jgi:hypothetical protein
MKGRVVYYQDPSAMLHKAWRWKYVDLDGTVISMSDKTYKTRRGAMDDWNNVQAVVDRLKRGVTE